MFLRERSEVTFGGGDIAVPQILRDFLDRCSHVLQKSYITVTGGKQSFAEDDSKRFWLLDYLLPQAAQKRIGKL